MTQGATSTAQPSADTVKESTTAGKPETAEQGGGKPPINNAHTAAPEDEGAYGRKRTENRKEFFQKLREHKKVKPIHTRLVASLMLGELIDVMEAMAEIEEQD